MKRAYILFSQNRGAKKNLERYVRYALRCGVAPIVPETYAVLLQSLTAEERELAAAAGRSYLWTCDELWVFGKEITKQMHEEMNFCRHLNIYIRRISDSEVKKKIGGEGYEK